MYRFVHKPFISHLLRDSPCPKHLRMVVSRTGEVPALMERSFNDLQGQTTNKEINALSDGCEFFEESRALGRSGRVSGAECRTCPSAQVPETVLPSSLDIPPGSPPHLASPRLHCRSLRHHHLRGRLCGPPPTLDELPPLSHAP